MRPRGRGPRPRRPGPLAALAGSDRCHSIRTLLVLARPPGRPRPRRGGPVPRRHRGSSGTRARARGGR
eukprot:229614-Lingulodinium_polyedra.AAC.1